MGNVPSIQVVNGPAIRPDVVVRLRKGEEFRAEAAARKNGAEDIFVSVGQDTYVASKRIGGSAAKPGLAAALGDKAGQIVRVDDDQSFKREGLSGGIKALFTIGAALVGVCGFTGVLVGLSGAGFAAIWVGVVVIAAALGVAVLGQVAADWAVSRVGKQADLEAIKSLGEVVD